jgi:hypothetical protein
MSRTPDTWIRRLGNLPELASVGVGLTASKRVRCRCPRLRPAAAEFLKEVWRLCLLGQR